MSLSYTLPRELIAQTPKEKREEARLLVLSRSTGRIRDSIFKEIVNLLGDRHLIVLNNTKVFPARLIASSDSGGKVEVLLVRERAILIWEVLGKPAKRLKKGCTINFDHGDFKAVVLEDGDKKLLKFDRDKVFQYGRVPLPPYIKRPNPGANEELDSMRYQTVYAKSIGSCACPTAGLHFTPELLSALKGKVAGIVEITLHVGPGTFRPIKTDNLETHRMEEEFFTISEEAASSINSAKKRGINIVAVGTSTVRALEQAGVSGEVSPGKGEARLFIRPGYRFKIINSLITNFHQPFSSPLAMVTAFAGEEFLKKAYSEAIKEKYRFLSYGDAMLIV